VILDADDRRGRALLVQRRDTDDVMVKDSSVGPAAACLRGRDSGKVDLIIIDTPANSKDIAMLAAEQADFVVIPVAPRGLDVHSVLQTVKQVQQAGRRSRDPDASAAPGRGGGEARAGFAAKGVTLFDTALHFRKDFYKATPIGKTAIELDPDSKAAAELRAAFEEAKRLSGYTTKPISEVA
jgi:chromosome partitioning protein